MANVKGNLDLSNDSILKLFLNYFLPMLCAMLAMASYTTVDGIFVNKKLGDEAMKAIVVVWPLFPGIMACSLMFALGAATLISYYLAKEKITIARTIFSSIVYFLFPLSLFIGILGYVNAEFIVDCFVKDLTPTVHAMAVEYLRGTCVGLFALVLHPVFDMCVVNDKRPRFAMFAMFLGAGCNVIFNYLFLFVLELGIIGSAYATVVGHGIGACILLWHYLTSKQRAFLLSLFRSTEISNVPKRLQFICYKQGDLQFISTLKWRFIGRACKFGFPYAASEFSVGIVMWLYNQTLRDIGGEDALAIYSAVLYAGFIFFTILIAFAESIQPIASFNYGMRNFERLKRILSFYLRVCFLLSLLIYAIFFIFDHYVVAMYLKNELLKEQSAEAIRIYFIGYVLLGANMIIGFYLQSLQRPLASFIVTISYTIMFIIVLLPVLTYFYGINGAWITYPIAQVCALCVGFCVLQYEKKKGLYC